MTRRSVSRAATRPRRARKSHADQLALGASPASLERPALASFPLNRTTDRELTDRLAQVVLEPPNSGFRTRTPEGGSLTLRESEPPFGGVLGWFPVPELSPIEGGDVLAFPARLFGRLPLSASLCCRSRVGSLPVVVTSARAVWLALRRRKQVVFGLLELDALVSGFENDRSNPYSLFEWCEYKRKYPTWRVQLRDAIGVIGNAVVSRGDGPAIGAVLSGWGLQLTAVSYGAAVPEIS